MTQRSGQGSREKVTQVTVGKKGGKFFQGCGNRAFYFCLTEKTALRVFLHRAVLEFMNKNILLLLFCGLFTLPLSGQNNAPVWVLDFVRVKSGHRTETLFYYENNWKLYRDTALARGYISAYRLLETAPDSLGNFDFVLMTAYPDSTAYARSEEHFQPVLKALRPEGPKLLNSLKTNDFRENVFFKNCRTLYAADAARPVKSPPAESLPFLKELNHDIWIPFAEAYATGDAEKYLALHSADFIRAQGDGQNTNDLAGYSTGVRSGFQRGKDKGGKTAIEFRFFERFSNGQTASERGIYKYTYTPPSGEAWSGYGQFHVFSRKENGRWKIVIDYDSSESGTVGAAEFMAGKRTEEW